MRWKFLNEFSNHLCFLFWGFISHHTSFCQSSWGWFSSGLIGFPCMERMPDFCAVRSPMWLLNTWSTVPRVDRIILNILGSIKYITIIYFTYFSLLFLNVAARKCSVTYFNWVALVRPLNFARFEMLCVQNTQCPHSYIGFSWCCLLHSPSPVVCCHTF